MRSINNSRPTVKFRLKQVVAWAYQGGEWIIIQKHDPFFYGSWRYTIQNKVTGEIVAQVRDKDLYGKSSSCFKTFRDLNHYG